MRTELLYGPDDAVFPKQAVVVTGGKFGCGGLTRDPYSNAQTVSKVVKGAFRAVGLEEFNPHSIRKTLAFLGDRLCSTMEARKAWSQNLGHDSLATTVSAYMPLSPERQGELLRDLSPRDTD